MHGDDGPKIRLGGFMDSIIKAALILAAGIALCGFALGGRFHVVKVEDGIARIDRWTGYVAFCEYDEYAERFVCYR